MTYETLIFDTAGSIATITLNRPDAANAMNPIDGQGTERYRH